MQCSELVAEYVLLALVASVHARRDENTFVLGKFGVNIFDLTPETHPAVERLTDLLQGLLPSVFHLPLTIENLNSIQLNPRKNSGANRYAAPRHLCPCLLHMGIRACLGAMVLTQCSHAPCSRPPPSPRLEAGALQLVDGTQLVLDECVLDSGTLAAQGVRNVTALGNLIQSQTVT
jgi:hypothetical protein